MTQPIRVSPAFHAAFERCARHWNWTGDVLEEMKAVCRAEPDYRFYVEAAAAALDDWWNPAMETLDGYRFSKGLPPLGEALEQYLNPTTRKTDVPELQAPAQRRRPHR